MDDKSSDSTARIDRGAFHFLVPCFFLLALGTYLSSPVSDAELYFHLTVGRWIRAHHQLPTANEWTVVDHLLPWRTGSWFFEYLLAAVEDLFGWNGLIGLKLIYGLTFVCSLAFLYSALCGEWFFASFTAALVSCGALEGVSYSPELLAWSCFVFLLALRLSPTPNGVLRSVLLLLIALLFAHSSPAYPFAIVLLVLMPSFEGRSSLGLDSVIFLLAYLLTPGFGTNGVQAARDSLLLVVNRLLLQLEPATVFDFSLAFLILLWLMLVLLCRRELLEGTQKRFILAAGALSALGMGAKEFLPWALILLGAALCAVWHVTMTSSVSASGKHNLEKAIEHLRQKLSKLPAVGVVWIAFCVIVVNSMNLFAKPVVEALLPRAEIDFILDRKLPFPLWHEAKIGAYLEYRFSDSEGNPTKLARVDERLILRHKDTALAESEGLWREEFLKAQPKTVLVRTYSPLYESLRENPRWRLVFQRGEEIDERGESVPNPTVSTNEQESIEVSHPEKNTKEPARKLTSSIPHYAWAVFTEVN